MWSRPGHRLAEGNWTKGYITASWTNPGLLLGQENIMMHARISKRLAKQKWNNTTALWIYCWEGVKAPISMAKACGKKKLTASASCLMKYIQSSVEKVVLAGQYCLLGPQLWILWCLSRGKSYGPQHHGQNWFETAIPTWIMWFDSSQTATKFFLPNLSNHASSILSIICTQFLENWVHAKSRSVLPALAGVHAPQKMGYCLKS